LFPSHGWRGCLADPPQDFILNYVPRRGGISPRASEAVSDLTEADSNHNNGAQQQRKQHQLCAAVFAALSDALGSDIDDHDLQDLTLAEVRPGLDGAMVAFFVASAGQDADHLHDRLRAAAGVFRQAMARRLTRKRVPSVHLYVVPAHSQEAP
jgi:ribosome-binding factor A